MKSGLTEFAGKSSSETSIVFWFGIPHRRVGSYKQMSNATAAPVKLAHTAAK